MKIRRNDQEKVKKSTIIVEIDENNVLQVKIVTTRNNEEVVTTETPLMKTTAEELQTYREKFSGLVVKIDGISYYTRINSKSHVIFSKKFGGYMCTSCIHMSATSDDEGGCAKVRLGEYIERYPWIIEGYETFNTSRNVFIITKCQHYQKEQVRKHRKKKNH